MESSGERTAGKIIISGVSSSSGKTLITCGLLQAFKNRNLKICAYKTGPDYIDTEYLRRSGHCEAYNLDTWLMNENSVLQLFNQTSKDKDIAVIEGAMGLYDGGVHSTARIAKLLNAPVILVINVKSLGESAAAIVSGFINYDKDVKIAGVILNFTGSASHEKIITEELKKNNVKVFGAVRRNEKFKIPERHLGLLPFTENEKFNFEFDAEKYVNVDEILPRRDFSLPFVMGGGSRSETEGFNLSARHLPLRFNPSVDSRHLPLERGDLAVAVAKDEAFNFYYPESLEALKNFGVELKFFSPLHDEKIPNSDICIFGGGFPEMFARELSENFSMLESVRNYNGKILAECGGLMYLCKSIKNLNDETFNMAGIVPFDSFMTDKPVIGYIEARALKDNILCEKDKIIRGHEFHYSRIEPEFYDENCAFEFTRRRTGISYYGGYSDENILASYLHINFFGNVDLIKRLLT